MKSSLQTAASIYIETYNDTATLLVPVNTTLPTVWKGNFSTASDKQASIDIYLLYGTSAKASQNTFLGAWTISGIPLLARGEPQITVQVQIDITGNVSVHANLEHNALAVTAKTQITRVPVKESERVMILECANSKPIQNPTESDIDWLFADDRARGDFVILSYSKQYYMQAAGEGNGSYTIECRAGDKEHHFRCAQSLSKQAVQSAFLKYLRYDSSFSNDFIWEKVEL
jgi:hypothetical protein